MQTLCVGFPKIAQIGMKFSFAYALSVCVYEWVTLIDIKQNFICLQCDNDGNDVGEPQKPYPHEKSYFSLLGRCKQN